MPEIANFGLNVFLNQLFKKFNRFGAPRVKKGCPFSVLRSVYFFFSINLFSSII